MVAINRKFDAVVAEMIGGLYVDVMGDRLGLLSVYPEAIDGRIAIFKLSNVSFPDMIADFRPKLYGKLKEKFNFGQVATSFEDDKVLVFTKDIGGPVADPEALLRSVRSDFVECATDVIVELNSSL